MPRCVLNRSPVPRLPPRDGYAKNGILGRMNEGRARPVVWMGDSRERVAGFPLPVRQSIGFALYQAQSGGRHVSARLLRGFSGSVWQVRADDSGGTYRAVYVTKLASAVFVLHAFQKKSKIGRGDAEAGDRPDPGTPQDCVFDGKGEVK